jgi:hypothetical protein
MAMTELITEVRELIEREYGRAGAKFGLTNNSDHESYAIILEELQEARTDVDEFEREMSMFWSMVKGDEADHYKYARLRQMQSKALLGACEMIQVAAMAKKAAVTICSRAALMESWEEGGNSE